MYEAINSLLIIVITLFSVSDDLEIEIGTCTNNVKLVSDRP